MKKNTTIILMLSLLIMNQKSISKEILANNQENEDNINQVIQNNPNPLIIEFSETWCGACKLSKPLVNEMKKETGYDIMIVEQSSDNLRTKYNIDGFPTFMLFKNGKPFGKIIGYTPYRTTNTIKNWVFNNKLTEPTTGSMCDCGCGHTDETCDCPDMKKK